MSYATTEPDGSGHRDLTLPELLDARSAGKVYAVEASDNRGVSYHANGLRWLAPEGARAWGIGLVGRWFGCTNVRVVAITPPPLGTQCGCTAAPAPHDDLEAHPFAYTVLEVVEQLL